MKTLALFVCFAAACLAQGTVGGHITQPATVSPGSVTLTGGAQGAANNTTLRDFQSVKDPACGAVGDGTTNDAPALNTCFALGIKTITFPQGTYLINSSVTVPSMQINLPPGATIIAGPSFPAATPMLSAANSSVVIQGGGVIDGNSKADNCLLIQATNAGLTTSLDFNGLTCQNTLNNGVYAKNAVRGRAATPLNGVQIRNSHFQNIAADGFLAVGAVNVQFQNDTTDTVCTAGAALSTTGCNAVGASSSTNVVLNNITMRNTTPIPSLTFNPGADLYMFADYNATITNVNSLRDPATTTTCVGNLCNVGLYFDTVVNSTATGNTVHGGGRGARIEVCKDFTFNSNTIAEPFGYGLLANTRANCTGCTDTATISAMDATTGFTPGSNVTLSIDTVDKKQSTGSLVSTFGAGFTSGAVWTFDATGYTQNWTISPEIDIWLESSVDTAYGQVTLATVNATGTLGTIPVPPLPANVWVRLELLDPFFGIHLNGSGGVTSIVLGATSTLGTAATLKGDFMVGTVPYDHVTANYNTIQRTKTDGIQIQGSLLNSTFNGNTIQDPGWLAPDFSTAYAGINYGPSNAGENSYNVSIQNNTVSQRLGGGPANIGIKVQSHNGATIIDSMVLNNTAGTMPVPNTVTVDAAEGATNILGLGTMQQSNCARSAGDGATNCDTNIGTSTFNTNMRFGRQANLGGGAFNFQIFKQDGTNTLPVSLTSTGTSRINGDGTGALTVGDTVCPATTVFCAGLTGLQKFVVGTDNTLQGLSLKLFGALTTKGGSVNNSQPGTATNTANSISSPWLTQASVWDGVSAAVTHQFSCAYSTNTTNSGLAPTFENYLCTAPVPLGGYFSEFQFGTSSGASGGTNFSSPILTLMASVNTAAQDKWKIQNVVGSGTNPTSTLTFGHNGSSGVADVAVPKLTINGGQTMSKPPIMTWSPSGPCAFTNGGCKLSSVWVVSQAITLNSWTMNLQNAPATCATYPVIGIKNNGSGADLATIQTADTVQGYTATGFPINVAAATAIVVYVKTAAVTCTGGSSGANQSSTVEYIMQ
jgi:hypothetical protein